MRVFILLSMFLLSNFSVAQQSTEKWNNVYNRYETFDSNGNMTSYKKWNSVYQRWEIYTVNSTSNNRGYEPNKKRTDDNFELLQKTMQYKQNKYNINKQRVDNAVNLIYSRIERFVLEELTAGRQVTNDDYRYSNTMKIEFHDKYLQKIINQNFDFSSDSTTDYVISNLRENELLFIRTTFSWLENVGKGFFQEMYLKYTRY